MWMLLRAIESKGPPEAGESKVRENFAIGRV